jgi:hypothetical protein
VANCSTFFESAARFFFRKNRFFFEKNRAADPKKVGYLAIFLLKMGHTQSNFELPCVWLILANDHVLRATRGGEWCLVVVVAVAHPEQREQSSRGNFFWEFFAPGPMITLKSGMDRLPTINRVSVVWWVCFFSQIFFSEKIQKKNAKLDLVL